MLRLNQSYNDFKIKGQALGNRFKWAELIKYIDYEQDRDSKAIGLANHSTKAKYGEYTAGTGKAGEEQSTNGRRANITDSNARTDASERNSQYEIPQGDERQPATGLTTDYGSGEPSGHSAGSYKEMEEYSFIDTDSNGSADTDLQSYPGIEIADDIDDEAIHGRNRHKQRKARTNRR
jgi:hypothetical protein